MEDKAIQGKEGAKCRNTFEKEVVMDKRIEAERETLGIGTWPRWILKNIGRSTKRNEVV
jgi:hypothetical protein